MITWTEAVHYFLIGVCGGLGFLVIQFIWGLITTRNK